VILGVGVFLATRVRYPRLAGAIATALQAVAGRDL
jgi:hypothetical protein